MVILNKLIAIWHNIRFSYEKEMKSLSQESGLPLAAIDILLYLFNHGRTGTAKEISQNLEMKSNLISSHVEKLAIHGYITREEVDGDRRQHALACTEKAVSICIKGKQIQKNYFKKLTKGISSEEYEILLKCFEKINDNAISMK